MRTSLERRTEIDLKECEHFLKANLNESEIDPSRIEWSQINAPVYVMLKYESKY